MVRDGPEQNAGWGVNERLRMGVCGSCVKGEMRMVQSVWPAPHTHNCIATILLYADSRQRALRKVLLHIAVCSTVNQTVPHHQFTTLPVRCRDSCCCLAFEGARFAVLYRCKDDVNGVLIATKHRVQLCGSELASASWES